MANTPRTRSAQSRRQPRELVERHGGRIWLESQAGEGTTVPITLPLLVDGATRVEGAAGSISTTTADGGEQGR